AGRLVRNPHRAVVQATSATLLEDDRNLDRFAPAPLAWELDLSDRMNPFRNPLEADHSKDALAQARCSDRRRELGGSVTWAGQVLTFTERHGEWAIEVDDGSVLGSLRKLEGWRTHGETGRLRALPSQFDRHPAEGRAVLVIPRADAEVGMPGFAIGFCQF